MKILLILSIILSACGQESLESTLPRKKIESRFIPDFNDFIEISKEYGFNPSFNHIRYMQTNDSIYNEGAVGMCYSNITLKREYYSPEHREDEYIYNQIEIVSQEILSDLEVDLKEVVYHELLHCIFKLDHDEVNREDIMFPYVGQSEKSADERLRNKFQEILDEKEEKRN